MSTVAPIDPPAPFTLGTQVTCDLVGTKAKGKVVGCFEWGITARKMYRVELTTTRLPWRVGDVIHRQTHEMEVASLT